MNFTQKNRQFVCVFENKTNANEVSQVQVYDIENNHYKIINRLKIKYIQ